MAVTLDVGQSDNVHPADKQTVGARLALAARGLVYGQAVPYSGPAFRQATEELQPDGTTSLRVWFDHAEGLTNRGKPLSAFEIAGPDHRFVSALARVEGETVLVHAPAVEHPAFVRFGWMGFVSGQPLQRSRLARVHLQFRAESDTLAVRLTLFSGASVIDG